MSPNWFKTLSSLFTHGVAHAFILHLNVADYVQPGARLHAYLDQALANRDIIAHYDRASGITFPLASMEDKATRALGLQPAQDPALAALAQVTGQSTAGDRAEFPRSPSAALPLLEDLMKANDNETNAPLRVAVIIDYAETIAPAADKAVMSPADRDALVTLVKWGTDRELEQRGQVIILLTRNLTDLHPDIRAASAKYEAIEVPLPGLTERQAFIEWYTDQKAIQFTNGLDSRTLAITTAGLSLVHIEDIFLNAQAGEGVTTEMVIERKSAIIKSEFGDVLEPMDNPATFADIGGLERVKEFFRKRVIRPLREGDRRRAPMGVLMTGPAGTGKSIMAQAVAAEAGVNFVNLRIGGQIASKWQGEGERNLEKALAAIDSLSPSIVFIDEIDQAVQRGGSGAGSQQDRRIFQRLLDYMADTRHRGRVCFLAATNRPDLMDAALRRPGRFDRKIPFLVPNAGERQAIMKVMARKYMGIEDFNMPPGDWELFQDRTQGWTGAEIEALAIKADELLYDGIHSDPILAVLDAPLRLSPSTADIEFMTMLALQECNDLDLLPSGYRQKAANRQEIARSITEMRKAREL